MSRETKIILIIIIAAIIFYYIDAHANEQVKVENYMKSHISEISPEKEVLGGKFYITDITFEDHSGIVKYEDGHIAPEAAFTYSVDFFGNVKIDDFQLINEES